MVVFITGADYDPSDSIKNGFLIYDSFSTAKGIPLELSSVGFVSAFLVVHRTSVSRALIRSLFQAMQSKSYCKTLATQWQNSGLLTVTDNKKLASLGLVCFTSIDEF